MERERLIRLPEVIDSVGLKRSSVYAQMSEGTFPLGVKVGPMARAWPESAIQGWIQERIDDAVSEEAQRQI